MKEVKTFVMADFGLFILKLIAGILCHSYTVIASGLYDLVLVISGLFIRTNKENKKYKGIVTSLYGFIMILLGIGIVFISQILEIRKVSLFIILFLLLFIIIRYLISCIYTNVSYQKKSGLLSYGVISSNLDFYNYGAIIGVLILSKLSKWIGILKYADRIGTILIAGLLVIRGIKIISNSFKMMETDKIQDKREEITSEILKRNEVNNIGHLTISSYGGLTKINCAIVIKDNLQLLDLNSFVVTLQDYLLKFANIVQINLVMNRHERKKKPRVRSLKQDARNSRSRNSKTNTKKKNSKQKNKKR